MLLFWKVFVLLCVVAVTNASIRIPIEEIKDTLTTDVPGFVPTIITGNVTCYRQPMPGVRPFIHDPWYLDEVEVITTTDEDGLYRLQTIPSLKNEKSIRITIRHRCLMENIPMIKECAIPMYTTEISLRLDTGKTYITYEFELDKMERYTRADCLY